MSERKVSCPIQLARTDRRLFTSCSPPRMRSAKGYVNESRRSSAGPKPQDASERAATVVSNAPTPKVSAWSGLGISCAWRNSCSAGLPKRRGHDARKARGVPARRKWAQEDAGSAEIGAQKQSRALSLRPKHPQSDCVVSKTRCLQQPAREQWWLKPDTSQRRPLTPPTMNSWTLQRRIRLIAESTHGGAAIAFDIRRVQSRHSKYYVGVDQNGAFRGRGIGAR